MKVEYTSRGEGLGRTWRSRCQCCVGVMMSEYVEEHEKGVDEYGFLEYTSPT